jgi:hypothetical protein
MKSCALRCFLIGSIILFVCRSYRFWRKWSTFVLNIFPLLFIVASS